MGGDAPRAPSAPHAAAAVKALAVAAAAVAIALGAVPLATMPLTAQSPSLAPAERRMRDWIAARRDEQITYLQRVVDIPSGTMNFAGVRKNAEVFRASLDSLGFETRWVPLDSVRRAGHLVAEHRGRPGRKTILLLGHLDTVFEGAGQGWELAPDDSLARGAGGSDMKGGNVVALYALKALAAAGRLKEANIILVFTGDEEMAGEPYAVSRRDLIEAGQRSDVALAFEAGTPGLAVVARRSSTGWRLTVSARQGHSSGVFSEGSGYGAIYEAARIVNAFRERLAGRPYLTFNPGIIAGGAEAELDSAGVRAAAAGKSNIIAPRAVVDGDLRTISDAQRDSARAVMREIVAQNLPGTAAGIAFDDGYPAMSPTPANQALLERYSEVSRALGQGPVAPHDPARRGAGDISFIAPIVPASLDGLGADGSGGHSPDERVNVNTLAPQTMRAAVLIDRIARERSVRTPRSSGGARP